MKSLVKDKVNTICPYCGFTYPEDMMVKIPNPDSEGYLVMCRGCYLTGRYLEHKSQ
jgi:hypothetical protein